jgi:hypothetical protein
MRQKATTLTGSIVCCQHYGLVIVTVTAVFEKRVQAPNLKMQGQEDITWQFVSW